MGIWAPLIPVIQKEERLEFSTGWGIFAIGFGLLIFGAIVIAMRLATLPMLRAVQAHDPLLETVVPWVLYMIAAPLIVSGIILLGYRKTLVFDRQTKRLDWRVRFWGICIKRHDLAFSEVRNWHVENIQPKRYKPEMNPKNKPVGFWRLSIETDQGILRLDQAPREEEIRQLHAMMTSFIEAAIDSS